MMYMNQSPILGTLAVVIVLLIAAGVYMDYSADKTFKVLRQELNIKSNEYDSLVVVNNELVTQAQFVSEQADSVANIARDVDMENTQLKLDIADVEFVKQACKEEYKELKFLYEGVKEEFIKVYNSKADLGVENRDLEKTNTSFKSNNLKLNETIDSLVNSLKVVEDNNIFLSHTLDTTKEELDSLKKSKPVINKLKKK